MKRGSFLQSRNRILQIFITLSCILYIIGILVAWSYPTKGNETSIYLSTPLVFWVAIGVCLIVGVITVLYGYNNRIGSQYSKYGWLLLILVSLSLSALFMIRGYFVVNLGGDTGTHCGNVQSLLETGHVISYYPSTYVETAMLYLLTGIDLHHLLNLNSLLFISAFLLGLYLLSGVICESKLERIFVMIVGLLLPFGSTYYATGGLSFSMYFPYLSGFLVFPLFMYMTYALFSNNKNHIGIGVCFILVGISLLTYHIFIFIICILLLFALMILYLAFRKQESASKNQIQYHLLILYFFVIMFFGWSYYNVNLIQDVIERVGESVLDDVSYDIYGDTLTQTVIGGYFENLSVLEIGELILRQSGLLMVMGTLFVLLVPFLLKTIKTKKYQGLRSIYIFTIFIVSLSVISFKFYLGTDPGRIIIFLSLCSFFSAGIFLSFLYQMFLESEVKMKKILSGVTLTAILIIIAVLSVVSFYPSIHTAVTSPKQVTYSSLDGIDFYLQNSTIYYDEIGVMGAFWRYTQALYSSTYVIQHDGTVKKAGTLDPPTDHFGYLSGKTLGENYASPTYLLLMNSYLANYNENPLWKHNTSPFTRRDLEELSSDKTVSKIYDNPEFSISVIYPHNNR